MTVLTKSGILRVDAPAMGVLAAGLVVSVRPVAPFRGWVCGRDSRQ